MIDIKERILNVKGTGIIMQLYREGYHFSKLSDYQIKEIIYSKDISAVQLLHDVGYDFSKLYPISYNLSFYVLKIGYFAAVTYAVADLGQYVDDSSQNYLWRSTPSYLLIKQPGQDGMYSAGLVLPVMEQLQPEKVYFF